MTSITLNPISLSSKAVTLLAAIIIFVRFLLPFQNVIEWDVFGYYIPLPAHFVHNDLKTNDTSWVRRVYNQYKPSSTLYQMNDRPGGHYAMRYPIGPAVLSLPFFVGTHYYLKYLEPTAADGFTLPYQYSYALAALFYTLLGLFFLRKFLLRYFNDKLTAALLCLIVLGTNYLQMVTQKNTLPHNYLFTLYAIMLYYTARWHERPKYKYAGIIGLCLGLITITRATEVIAFLIPVLWGIADRPSIRQNIHFFLNRRKHLLVAAVTFIIAISPQILYWKYATGSWLYRGYRDPAVGLDFTHPYTLQYLFSFRKGWFIYTPLMLFASIGFYHLYRRNRPLFWPVLVYSLVNLYIVSSWTCWWYAGGSFSARAQVSSYGLLALPLGYLLQELTARGLKILALSAGILLVSHNLFEHLQEYAGVMDGDRMTMAYYFRTFGRLSATPEDKKLLLYDRSQETLANGNELSVSQLANWDFESSTSDRSFLCDSIAHSGQYSYAFDCTKQFSPALAVPYRDLTSKEYAWIRAGVWIYVPEGTLQLPELVVDFEHKGYPYHYRSKSLPLDSSLYNKWTYLTTDYLTPEVRSPKDQLKVFVWNKDKSKILIDDFKIEKYEPEK